MVLFKRLNDSKKICIHGSSQFCNHLEKTNYKIKDFTHLKAKLKTIRERSTKVYEPQKEVIGKGLLLYDFFSQTKTNMPDVKKSCIFVKRF